MAEERLIDDDKDRKYKIRINEDGEEELVIDETAEDEEDETPVFDVPDYDADDEEAAILTPEQLAERERIRLEEEQAKRERLAYLLETGRAKLDGGEFEAALYAANQAQELDGENGEVYCFKLLAATRNFTDYTAAEDCTVAAEGVRQYATAEQKAELSLKASDLDKRIQAANKRCADMLEEVNTARDERRPFFARKKRRAAKAFSIALIPFVAFLVLAIAFCAYSFTVMYAEDGNTFITLAIVFAALAVISLVIVLITAHKLWEAMRNVRLNEKDSSTKLGREYLEVKNEADRLSLIYSSFNN